MLTSLGFNLVLNEHWLLSVKRCFLGHRMIYLPELPLASQRFCAANDKIVESKALEKEGNTLGKNFRDFAIQSRIPYSNRY